jgi:uncharacterized protein (DUF433 family)
MLFPTELASVLSGATVGQLRHWRSTGLLVPEKTEDGSGYTFLDLVALRIVVRLRAELSLQKVRTAFKNLPVYNFTAHPGNYRFGTDGDTIAVYSHEEWTNLVRKPGHPHLFSLDELFASFTNRTGQEVVDFRRPRRHLRVDAERLGGWPTIAGTRVGFDTVAALMGDGSLSAEDVHHYYPSVPPVAVADAVSFADAIEAVRRSAA